MEMLHFQAVSVEVLFALLNWDAKIPEVISVLVEASPGKQTNLKVVRY